MKQESFNFQQALMAVRVQRLHFAVRFAQADLATLREGDWLNLREEFLAFLGQSRDPQKALTVSDAGGPVTCVMEGPRPQEFAVEDFGGLQADVRTILGAAAGDILGEPIPVIGVKAALYVQPTVGLGGYVTNLIGPTRDMFLFLLLDVLRQEPPDRVLRCPACQALFIRAYTQVYCSRRCTNRAGIRAWRQRHDRAAMAG